MIPILLGPFTPLVLLSIPVLLLLVVGYAVYALLA